jgi:hypothetical protein
MMPFTYTDEQNRDLPSGYGISIWNQHLACLGVWSPKVPKVTPLVDGIWHFYNCADQLQIVSKHKHVHETVLRVRGSEVHRIGKWSVRRMMLWCRTRGCGPFLRRHERTPCTSPLRRITRSQGPYLQHNDWKDAPSIHPGTNCSVEFRTSSFIGICSQV